MIKVLFICHGNICRSTMAQSVFTHLAAEANLADYFEIDSAATSREEIGNTPHYGTVRKLREENIPLIPHRARQMTRNDYLYYDYLIGMDTANIRNMIRIAGGEDSQVAEQKSVRVSLRSRGRGLLGKPLRVEQKLFKSLSQFFLRRIYKTVQS